MSELAYQLKKGYVDQASNEKFLSVNLGLYSYCILVTVSNPLKINR